MLLSVVDITTKFARSESIVCAGGERKLSRINAKRLIYPRDYYGIYQANKIVLPLDRHIKTRNFLAQFL